MDLIPSQYHHLYAASLDRANRAERIGHRQLTERRMIEFEDGVYSPTFDDLDSTAALDLLNALDLVGDVAPFQALADRLCSDHEADGKMLLNAEETLPAMVRDYLNNQTDATDAELAELARPFRTWCGFAHRRAPNGFHHPERGPGDRIAAGDYVWLIDRTPAQLKTWLENSLADLRA